MKNKTRFLTTILILAMCLMLFSSCVKIESDTTTATEEKTTTAVKEDNTPDYLNLTGLPIVKKPITITMMADKDPENWNNDTLVVKEMEKRTGIHVEWNSVAHSVLTEKKNVALASGDYPDAFYSVILDEDINMYGPQGMFIKLNDLIDKYAPELKAIFKEEPEVRKSQTAPDGSIYAMPYIIQDPPSRVTSLFFINNDWLKKLNLNEPKNTDELYAVLKAFLEQDPNGNGQKDEVPMTSTKISRIYGTFKGMWGFGTGACRRIDNVDVDKNGNIRFMPTDPKYKEMLEYIAKLYKEGLLDQEIYTMKEGPMLLAKMDQNKTGVVINGSLPDTRFYGTYKGISAAIKGPYGDQMHIEVNPLVDDVGAFVITDKNKYPEATTRWADYLYSEEGAELLHKGIKGITFELDQNGNYVWTDLIKNNPNGLTLSDAMGFYGIGGVGPSILRSSMVEKDKSENEILRQAKKNMVPYLPREVWTEFMFKPEETDELTGVATDIDTYVKEKAAEFITGKTSFSEWDNYVETIKKMGLDTYMKIYKAAYERYKKS